MRRWSLCAGLAAVLGFAALYEFSGAQVNRTAGGTVGQMMADPVTRLQAEVSKLTEQAKAQKTEIDGLKQQIAALRDEDASLRYLIERPGGIQGYKIAHYYKYNWDRLPGDTVIRVWVKK
jgi:hypothetical protein